MSRNTGLSRTAGKRPGTCPAGPTRSQAEPHAGQGRPGGLLVAGLIVLTSASCIVLKRTIEVESVPLRNQVRVESPVRAHLMDGTIALFKSGVSVGNGQVLGSGWHYGLNLRDSVAISAIALDSILAMEAYRNPISSSSVVYSILGTGLAIGGALAIACAADPKCFGSCPTIYSDSGGVAFLEAEGFSYSIAPLFEVRDVDRLRATADSSGVVSLEIRNEAFETHYINHLELLETIHADDERVVPTSDGRYIAARGLHSPITATDRTGRSVRAEIETHDGTYFQTAPNVLARAAEEDLEDAIELDLGNVATTDSVVLVFRMRNSLLATVLFYDLMLGDRGARALDWQTYELERLTTAVELGEWSREHLGMRVSVQRQGEFEPVGRVGDSGPVAWKDIAIVIPAPDRGGRVRLAFPADGWRIDWLAVATDWRTVEPRIVPIKRVIATSGSAADALESLGRADTRYLMTLPGQAFHAEFDVGAASGARTFLLASQGYYIEWIRQEWLRTGRDSSSFRPERASLADAMRRWATAQDTLEQRFYATRVPVR